MSKERTKSSGNLRSPPLSPPYNSPHSPHSPARELTPNNGLGSPFDAPHSPITALPQPHAPNTPRVEKEKSKGIFSTAKFSKSQSRLATESPIDRHGEGVPAMASVYQNSPGPGSTPELAHQAAEASSASDRKSSSQLTNHTMFGPFCFVSCMRGTKSVLCFERYWAPLSTVHRPRACVSDSGFTSVLLSLLHNNNN